MVEAQLDLIDNDDWDGLFKVELENEELEKAEEANN